ncbi:glutamate receptor 4-like [Palaemon carinicauda]|uniref:glutamate receptor 4-like n=1 Tax=Palaemon carinicauda TaxID=392227 RepID=UPI0035B5A0C1
MLRNKNPPYKVAGAAVDLMEIILGHLGYCSELVKDPTDYNGIELPNGTWTGSLGMLNRNEANMSMTVYMVTSSRIRAVDFSEPVYMEEQGIAYARPQLKSDISSIAKPYTNEIWLGIFINFLIMMMTIALINAGYHRWIAPVMAKLTEMENRDDQLSQMGTSKRRLDENKGSYLWTFCTLLAQSFPWQPVGNSVRIICSFWLLMAFILATVYRTNLVAMLIKPLINLPFTSLETLAKTDAKIYGYTDSRFMAALKNASEGSTFATVKKNFVFDVGVEEGAKGFMSLKWGVTSSKTTIKFGFHVDFSRPKVDLYIRRLREAGITEHLVNRYMPNATECLGPMDGALDNKKRPLTIEDLLGALYIWLSGMFLSFLAFIQERWSSKRARNEVANNE